MPTTLRMRSVLTLVVLILLVSVPAFAQMETATLSGVIQDPNGGAVPDVEVTATRIETGTVVTTKTNGAGIYFFTGLMPGHYHLMVRKPGFKEIAIKEFQMYVQDKLEQNFSLEIGSVSETVTVTASGLNVNTSDGSVSTIIDRNFVERLPLNGRSFNTLLQLTPGVVIAPAPPGSPGQFSIAGQRTDANNFTVDGVSANFGVALGSNVGQSGTGGAQAFSALGGTSSLVSVEALQEFRIETSSFAPEFGRTPGGQVILMTRSGTNDFHGGIYEYFRNDVLDANNWFNGAATPQIRKAPERHNDFGGFLGGPILKGKTFFFASYEGARLRLPNSQLIQVPSAFARSQAPSTLAPFLNAYPKPNGQPASPTGYTAPFTGSYFDSATLDAGSVRIDHTFNGRFSIFGRYNNAPSQILQRQSSLSDIASTNVNTQTATLGVIMSLKPQILNSFRGNYSTQSSERSLALDSFGGAVPLDSGLLLGALPTSQNLGLFNNPQTKPYSVGLSGKNQTQQINFADDLSVTVAVHQLKLGTDYRAIFFDVNTFQHETAFFVPNIQTFLSTAKANVTGVTQHRSQFLDHAVSLYGQDTWKATQRLTLVYGLRWELSPAPSARGATTLASWMNTDNPAHIAFAPLGTPVWGTTYGNIAPRLGIAYSLTPRGDFVLRAGGGIFYDLGVGSSANLAFDFPNSARKGNPGVSVPFADVTPLLPSISLQPPFSGVIEGFSPSLKLPRSYQWNVALEKSFAGKQAISATYVGQAGRDLLRKVVLFQPNSSFPGDFGLTGNDARSNYNALQVQYRRPLASRLQALLNYTWSHSLDSASDDVALGFAGNIILAGNDYASSVFDIRHSFSAALSYDVPGAAKSGPIAFLTRAWSLQTVIVVRSGFPFNANVSSTSPDLGGSATSRPDLVPGQPLWISSSTAPGGQLLNAAAFSIPSSPRQGTEGRNDIPGFGLTQVDMSIGRKFSIRERLNLQFRADAFNLFNHPNFTNPLANLEVGPASLQSQFMLNQVLGGLNPLFQQGGPRSLQLSLKMTF